MIVRAIAETARNDSYDRSTNFHQFNGKADEAGVEIDSLKSRST